MSKKGSAFEREVCKLLSLWWTNNKTDDVYWRSNASGARAKIRSKQGKKTFGQYGDIQASDPVGQDLIDLCTIELKRGYRGTSVADVLDKGKKSAKQKWEEFLEQVTTDQKNSGSPYWLLITRRDRRETVIFMPFKLWKSLFDLSENKKDAVPYLSIKIEKYGKIVGMQLSKFFLFTNRKIIMELAKNE